MGMGRVLANPQDSAPTPNNKATKFIMNSGSQMQSLTDLDRKTKHAVMKS